MKTDKTKIIGIVVLSVFLLFLSSCTKRYIITTEMEKPIDIGTTCSIGQIADELPIGIEEEDKPSLEDVEKLKSFIVEELNKKDALIAHIAKHNTRYEINGSILEFKKGSGALRFFIGFGAGSARLVTHLQLIDKNSGNVIFAGNFTSTVSDGLVDGEKIFRQTAKDFTSQLFKQLKKLGVEVHKI